MYCVNQFLDSHLMFFLFWTVIMNYGDPSDFVLIASCMYL